MVTISAHTYDYIIVGSGLKVYLIRFVVSFSFSWIESYKPKFSLDTLYIQG